MFLNSINPKGLRFLLLKASIAFLFGCLISSLLTLRKTFDHHSRPQKKVKQYFSNGKLWVVQDPPKGQIFLETMDFETKPTGVIASTNVIYEPLTQTSSVQVVPHKNSVVSLWKDDWKIISASNLILKYQFVPLRHDLFQQDQFPNNLQWKDSDREAMRSINDYCQREKIRNRYNCYMFIGKNESDQEIILQKLGRSIPLEKARGDDSLPLLSYLGNTFLGIIATPAGVLTLPGLYHGMQAATDGPKTNLVVDYFKGLFVVPALLIVINPVSKFLENNDLIKVEAKQRAHILENKPEQSFPISLEPGQYFWRWVIIKNKRKDIPLEINFNDSQGKKRFKQPIS